MASQSITLLLINIFLHPTARLPDDGGRVVVHPRVGGGGGDGGDCGDGGRGCTPTGGGGVPKILNRFVFVEIRSNQNLD